MTLGAVHRASLRSMGGNGPSWALGSRDGVSLLCCSVSPLPSLGKSRMAWPPPALSPFLRSRSLGVHRCPWSPRDQSTHYAACLAECCRAASWGLYLGDDRAGAWRSEATYGLKYCSQGPLDGHSGAACTASKPCHRHYCVSPSCP